jgi:beta-lactamase regulating signal transducer with metallopeptidase domain/protocatechuate 3,4-dioxygenase beta subunit
MIDFLNGPHGNALVVDILWQSSLFLMVGLVASLALRQRPARAHRVLLLAMLGAVVTPLGSQMVRHEGWGLWSLSGSGLFARSGDRPEPGRLPSDSDAFARVSPSGESRSWDRLKPELQREGLSAFGASAPIEVRAELQESFHLRAIASPSLRSVLLGLWGISCGLCMMRLITSLIAGRLIVRRARLIADGPLVGDAATASKSMGLPARPDLLSTDRVSCPAIWCWGRPMILLPEPTGRPSVDWVGVFCHELAHWVRRDHLSSLVADLVTCLLPWNPLAWWARRRLNQLSELACDDWAIAGGRDPVAYARTLVDLVPRRRMTTAMAAVSRRGGLAGRVAHIIESGGIVEPRPGRGWSVTAALVVLGLIPIIALAQVREDTARIDEMKKSGTTKQPPAAQPVPRGTAVPRAVRGTVRDASGQPVAGASVFAVAQRTDGKEGVLTRASTDRSGKYTLDVPIDPDVLNLHVVARATGMGLVARNTSVRPDAQGQMRFEPLSEQTVDLTMPPNVPIEGRLLSPAGAPVAGASVSLDAIQVGSREKRDGFGLWPTSDEPSGTKAATYWPAPAVTDSQGRFRLEGFSAEAQAELKIVHPDFIHESLTVSTKAELSDWHKQWNIRPVTPRFSHTLEPARPIDGVVADQDTGKPLAGVNIEISVSRAPEWRFRFHTRTDAQGRYRVMGIAWNLPQYLYANVDASAASGYLHRQFHREGWPAGTKDLRWDFAIKKGRFITGKVIDGDTKRPIAGARVGSTGLTDAQGIFSLATSPGTCLLFVEGPTPNYQRVTVPRSLTNRYYTYYPHGFAKLEVPEEGKVAPVEIAIRKGATIAAQAVDPDGKPLPKVWVSGLSLYASGDRTGQTAGFFSNGLFRMSSFVPGQPYRIFFIQNERNLAGFADLVGSFESFEPVKVVLRPTAIVKGKLLKPDGSHDRGRRISVHVLMSREPVKHDTMDFLVMDQLLSYSVAGQRGRYDGVKTNDQGEFEVRDLVPGVTNYLAPLISSNRTEFVSIEPLRPGEVRDLGAVKPIVLTSE